MESSQEQSDSMHEDFLQICALYSKKLERSRELIESNREFKENLDYLESSIKEKGLKDPKIMNEDYRDNLM